MTGGVFLCLGQIYGVPFALAWGLWFLLLALATVRLIRRELSKKQPRDYLPLLQDAFLMLTGLGWLWLGHG